VAIRDAWRTALNVDVAFERFTRESEILGLRDYCTFTGHLFAVDENIAHSVFPEKLSFALREPAVEPLLVAVRRVHPDGSVLERTEPP
jgi:hypothetical protein